MNAALLVAVAAGGLVGAPSRYLLDRLVHRRWESDLPWGTFLVNMAGSLLLGFLTGLELADHLPSGVKAVAAIGFCGAFTTFSTFTFETVRLVEAGELLEAALNAVGGVVLGLAAAAAGVALGLAV